MYIVLIKLKNFTKMAYLNCAEMIQKIKVNQSDPKIISQKFPSLAEQTYLAGLKSN